MNIQKMFIKYNFTPKPNRKIEYVVIHDTGNRGFQANARMHFQYFNGGDRQSSADYFVDDKEIVQLVDSENAYSWAVGDGGGKYGITNANSVSIEICLNSDGNYDLAFQNAIELAICLLEKYKLPTDRLVTHNSASKKNCPQSMNNNGDWSKWLQFKKEVANQINLKKILSDTRLVNSPTYWNIRLKPKKTIKGEYAKQLILNFTAMFKLCNTYDEVLSHLVAMGVIKSPDYWRENATDGKEVRGDYMKQLIINMGSKL